MESDRVPSFSKALEHGKPVTVDGKSTLADGLAVPRVGCNAFATAANLVDKMVSVSDASITDSPTGCADKTGVDNDAEFTRAEP